MIWHVYAPIKRSSKLQAESDLDDDGMLSFAEFEHVVAKSTDFEQ